MCHPSSRRRWSSLGCNILALPRNQTRSCCPFSCRDQYAAKLRCAVLVGGFFHSCISHWLHKACIRRLRSWRWSRRSRGGAGTGSENDREVGTSHHLCIVIKSSGQLWLLNTSSLLTWHLNLSSIPHSEGIALSQGALLMTLTLMLAEEICQMA